MRAAATLALALLAGIGPADAAEPQLRGHWTQGGTIVGRVEPGASVALNGKPLAVSPEGWFVFGFGRDAGPAAELRVRSADGATWRREFTVQPREYEVQRIDGLPEKLVTPPPEAQKRIDRDNRLVAQARARNTPRADFNQTFIRPVPGPQSSAWGNQRVLNGVPKQPHFGVDLASPEGTPIRASAGGIVSVADPDLYFTGGTVFIDHGQGLATTYLHLSRLDVKVGDEVKAGQVIGAVGATGRATGPHLCWRASWFDVRLDPSLLVTPEK